MKNTIRFPFIGELEGWTVNFLCKNKWRLKDIVSKEEVLKDAYRIYLDCMERYAAKVDNEKWFFSLYRTCFINYFHSVSTYVTFLNDMESLEVLLENDPDLEYNLEVNYNLGELMCKMEELPPEIKKIIDFVINTTSSGNEFEITWKAQGKKKAFGNEYICKALGYNHRKVDVIAMVYDYFIDEN